MKAYRDNVVATCWYKIIIVAVFCFGLLVSTGVETAEAQWAYRKDINELGPQQLQALRDAVAVMKSRDHLGLSTSTRNTAEFRKSWVFWANMHGHWGVGCHSLTKPVSDDPNEPIIGLDEILIWNQIYPAEIDTWCTCAHSEDDTRYGDVGEDGHFLTWHRLYLAAFEKVLREAAQTAAIAQGRPNNEIYKNVALPYWDYNASATLPVAVREPTYINFYTKTATSNPLYTPHRDARINNGSRGATASILSGAARALEEDTYQEFNLQVEQSPHAGIHCLVSPQNRCRNGLMGPQESAGMEFVFWLHHTNIDRIYECWLNRNGGAAALPTRATFRDKVFRFVTPNGAPLAMRVGDNLTSGVLKYTYGHNACKSLGAQPVQVEEVAIAKKTNVNAYALTAATILSLLAPEATTTVTVPRRNGKDDGRPLRLWLEDVTPDVQGRVVDVYLVAPNGKRVMAGSMAFFGSKFAVHGDHRPTATFNFNITKALDALGVRAGTKLQLVFETTEDIDVVDAEGYTVGTNTVVVNPGVQLVASQIAVDPE